METTKYNRLMSFRNSFGQDITYDAGENTDYCLTIQEFSIPGMLPDSDYYAAKMSPELCEFIRPLVPAWNDPADWKVATFRVSGGCPTGFSDAFPDAYHTALHRVTIIPLEG